MKEHYLSLLAYNSWVNHRFMSSLEESPLINNKIYLLFSHVLTAEEIWLCRARGEAAPLQRLWQQYDTPVLREKVEENAQAWPLYLSGLQNGDLMQEISYQNTKGETYSTPLYDIITHLVNHGTHHRGQMASLMQQEKVQPPVSDYIVYVRQKESTLA